MKKNKANKNKTLETLEKIGVIGFIGGFLFGQPLIASFAAILWGFVELIGLVNL